MLWPGYFAAEFDKMPKPILEEIPVLHVSADGPAASQNTANCCAEIEDFPAGSGFFWFFPYDEMHYVVDGEADLTYSLGATSHTLVKKAHIAPGDWYIAPMASRVTWNVSPKGRLRIMSVVLPGVPSTRPKRSELLMKLKKA